MKNILLILFVGILLVSFVSAICQTNNDFETGEDFNVCTGQCKFYDLSASSYEDCDSSTECYLTMVYPNGTFLSTFELMQFNTFGDEIFNYSFGNITDSDSFPSGIYQGQLNCYSSDGFSDPINFEASVSSPGVSVVSGTGAGYPFKINLDSLDIDYKEKWCFDVEYEVIIKPLDLEGNLTKVLIMNYYSDADFLQTGGLYKKDLIYYMTFLSDSVKANFTGEEDIVISIQANQWGKIISEDLRVSIKECTSLEKTARNVIKNVSDFWSDNKILVGVILFIILIFIITAVLYLKRKN